LKNCRLTSRGKNSNRMWGGKRTRKSGVFEGNHGKGKGKLCECAHTFMEWGGSTGSWTGSGGAQLTGKNFAKNKFEDRNGAAAYLAWGNSTERLTEGRGQKGRGSSNNRGGVLGENTGGQ